MMASAAVLMCSICGDPSNDICVYCTKDACLNHRCDRCKRCSDCCDCDVPLSAEPKAVVETVADPAPEHVAEPVLETVIEPVEEAPPADDTAAFDSVFAPEPEYERPRYEPATYNKPPDDVPPSEGTPL
jgi:hypothetical protein